MPSSWPPMAHMFEWILQNNYATPLDWCSSQVPHTNPDQWAGKRAPAHECLHTKFNISRLVVWSHLPSPKTFDGIFALPTADKQLTVRSTPKARLAHHMAVIAKKTFRNSYKAQFSYKDHHHRGFCARSSVRPAHWVYLDRPSPEVMAIRPLATGSS